MTQTTTQVKKRKQRKAVSEEEAMAFAATSAIIARPINNAKGILSDS